MNDEERKEFVYNEIEAIFDELDSSITQLVLSRHFLKELVSVTKGREPNYQFSKIVKLKL